MNVTLQLPPSVADRLRTLDAEIAARRAAFDVVCTTAIDMTGWDREGHHINLDLDTGVLTCTPVHYAEPLPMTLHPRSGQEESDGTTDG